MPAERLQEYRAGNVPFPSVRLNSNTIVDLFPKKMWQKSAQAGQGRENLNHFCISLNKEEWDNLIKRLEANKVGIEEGPAQRWGAHGTGMSIIFETRIKTSSRRDIMRAIMVLRSVYLGHRQQKIVLHICLFLFFTYFQYIPATS